MVRKKENKSKNKANAMIIIGLGCFMLAGVLSEKQQTLLMLLFLVIGLIFLSPFLAFINKYWEEKDV